MPRSSRRAKWGYSTDRMGWFGQKRTSVAGQQPADLEHAQATSETMGPAHEPTCKSIVEPASGSTFESISKPTFSRTQSSSFYAGTPLQVAERHASHLLEKLVQECGGRRIFSDSARKAYEEMCGDIGIPCRPWNMVGMYLRQLTERRGRPSKSYIAMIDEAGKKYQIPIFFIPVVMPSPLPQCRGPRRKR